MNLVISLSINLPLLVEERISMYLLPPETFKPYGMMEWGSYNNNTEFLGYWQSSESFHYSCGFFAPVYLFNRRNWLAKPGTRDYCEDWDFDYPNPKVEKGDWVLFFPGCDDGSLGMYFQAREDALKFIEECQDVDFYRFVYPFHEKKQAFKMREDLCWHN